MSIEALRWALDKGMEENLEPTLRYVLLILGNRADEQGYLFPSVNWVCERTGLSRRTVQTHLQTLEKRNLLTRDVRVREDGGRTSDYMQLPLMSPGFAFENPGADSAPPRAMAARGGRNVGDGGGAMAAPYTQDDTQDQKKGTPTPQKPGEGEQLVLTEPHPPKPPTPTAAAWQAYKAAIRKRYGVEPPMSPKAMGQLSQLVARVGAENAVAVVEHYVGTQKPYYQAQKHPIDTLLKDCHSLYMEMKAQHGDKGQPQVKSTVHFMWPDNTDRKMGDVPAGEAADAEALAKKWAHDYSRLIGEKGFVHVAIVTGANRKVFSIAELRGRG